MGWLIALGVLALIAIVPVGASVFYDEAGPKAFIIAGPLRICVFPMKKREKMRRMLISVMALFMAAMMLLPILANIFVR